MCVCDVLNDAGTAVMTPAQFVARWPALRCEVDVYEDTIHALPEVWWGTLRGEQSGRATQIETWWHAADDTYWRQWTRPAKVDKPSVRLTGRYVREANTARVRPADPPEMDAALPRTCVECVAQPVRTNEKVEPDWVNGTSRAVRRARDDEWTHEIVADDAEGAREPLDGIGMQPPGLLPRPIVPLTSLSTGHMRQMLTAPRPAMPRAWDPTSKDVHYAKLYAHLDHVAYIKVMRRVFAVARHPSIPPRIQDVLYKTLVSGHDIGCKRRKGAEAICPRCGGSA